MSVVVTCVYVRACVCVYVWRARFDVYEVFDELLLVLFFYYFCHTL